MSSKKGRHISLCQPFFSQSLFYRNFNFFHFLSLPKRMYQNKNCKRADYDSGSHIHFHKQLIHVGFASNRIFITSIRTTVTIVYIMFLHA